jgi:hypothetical protein
VRPRGTNRRPNQIARRVASGPSWRPARRVPQLDGLNMPNPTFGIRHRHPLARIPHQLRTDERCGQLRLTSTARPDNSPSRRQAIPSTAPRPARPTDKCFRSRRLHLPRDRHRQRLCLKRRRHPAEPGSDPRQHIEPFRPTQFLGHSRPDEPTAAIEAYGCARVCDVGMLFLWGGLFGACCLLCWC